MKIKLLLFLLTILVCSAFINCGKGNDTAAPGSSTTASMDTSTKIVIPGTGSSQDILRALAGKFMEMNQGESVEIPASIGSGGGIKAVMNKTANVARVSRKLKDTEEAAGLTYEEFAKTPIVFATHPDIKVKNLKTSDIIKIYSGKITNWKQLGAKNQKIIVIGRDSGDSSRSVIESVIKEFKGLAFPADMLSPKTDQEMISALQVKPGAIGFGTFANMKSKRLNILNLDGNVAGTEKYTLMGAYAFVYYKDKLSPLSKKFLEFVFGSEGKKIIESQYCIIIPRKN